MAAIRWRQNRDGGGCGIQRTVLGGNRVVADRRTNVRRLDAALRNTLSIDRCRYVCIYNWRR